MPSLNDIRDWIARGYVGSRPEPDPFAEPEAEGLTRRGFLGLVGAGAALAACAQAPSEKIIPYTHQPPEVTPGVPRKYATAMVVDGLATGLVVDNHEGRPTKIEGNPDHPFSLGAAGAFEQAHVLGLYDPDRARTIWNGDEAQTRESLFAWLAHAAPVDGTGLWIVMSPTSSPLLVEWIGKVRARMPAVRFVFHSAAMSPSPVAGLRAVFGRTLVPQWDLGAADVVVSLDANFLAAGHGWLRHARQFADRRRVTSAADGMNRFYQLETTFSPTGSLADHRVRVRPSDLGAVAAALAVAVGGEGIPAAISEIARFAPQDWVNAIAADLTRHRGGSLIIAGDSQPPIVHALCAFINQALGSRAVVYTNSPIFEAGQPSHDLVPLTDAMSAGTVRMLACLEVNPVYDAPADLGFAEGLAKVPDTLHLGLHVNETGKQCQWRVPALHALETWGDARAADGTVSFVQPLVAPLFGHGVDSMEILAALAGEPVAPTRARLRDHWLRAGLDEPAWERALQRGIVEGTALPEITANPSWANMNALPPLLPPSAAGSLELSLTVDDKVLDGRFGNNAWLQELPAPMTKVTWGNAALLSPATARQVGVTTGDVVALTLDGRTVSAPVFVLPGHADGAVTLALGYGRQGTESVARGVGVNAYALRTTSALFDGRNVTLVKTGQHVDLAITQEHWTMEDRPIGLSATLDAYRANQDSVTRRQKGPVATLLDDSYTPQAKNQWAMSIDLGVCTGCSACVVACQAENNTPTVGAEGVRRSREMHWLRIDRYITGSDDDPRIVNQPMMCQHCEKAPCEYVCPVDATVHSDDGLNEMVYNRCVGTRFCSNNCPYKVRRFNFLDYVARDSTELQKNPDVTVRRRGVMEKCTYCVQRIRRAEISARVAGRDLADGDVITACQQACPTQAIVFGSLGDPASRVVRLRQQARDYQVLHDLGTQPRTHYLVKIVNTNPDAPLGPEAKK